tara:strand:- start:210 stop:1427 length:1218 start_codon:yes stop_codon:yes gene_type:complete
LIKYSNHIVDCIIVGSGIIGLSTAFEYIKSFPKHKLLILEKESEIFAHQSGRNSGVIHSGIYYKPNSLKAKNCIEGYSLLIDFVKKHKIPFKITGKLIIAYNKNQIKDLNKLYNYGISNGLKKIKILNSKESLKIEPHCKKVMKALYVPQSGIIDYKSLGSKILKIINSKGVQLSLNTCVKKIKTNQNEVSVFTNKKIFKSKKVVVCTGVFSDKFLSPSLKNKFRVFPFKGEYYNLKPSVTKYVKGLIYPVPDLNFPFLGVHLTKTIDNKVEAGPNAVLAFSREGYNKMSFNLKDFSKIIFWKGFWKFFKKVWRYGFYEYYRSFSKKEFTRSLQNLIPEIKKDDIVIGKSGIRAQVLSYDGKLIDDFLIDKNDKIFNVINAPSPAATSCFAIAKNIVKKIKKGDN